MSIPAREFHHFPKLPTELREEIWSYCLPERVCELTVPVDDIVFWQRDNTDGPWPCELWQTTYSNGRPPLISRVCHESRSVALKSCRIIPAPLADRPPEAQWRGVDVVPAWQDRLRDSVHLNWACAYEADYGFSDDSPAHYLAWEASRLPRGGSFMIRYLESLDSSRCVSLDSDMFEKSYGFLAPFELQAAEKSPISLYTTYGRARFRDIDALQRLSSWRVVMRVIVVHTNAELAAATGLFGLSGDARVQLIDASEEDKVEAYFTLAENCERQNAGAVKQDFRRDSATSMEERIRAAVTRQFGSEALMAALRPVVMFRLCTHMCNHTSSEPERQRTAFFRNLAQRGRGRGPGLFRGRGR